MFNTFTKYTFTPTDDLDTVTVGGIDLEADDAAATFIVNIRTSDLDISNAFTHLRVIIDGDDLANPCEGIGLYMLYAPRIFNPVDVVAGA